VNFNQDSSCFAVGTETGFKVFSTIPFKDTFERVLEGGIGRVEMLYRSNILALVGGGDKPKYDKKKVVLWDDSETKVITELRFSYEILNVKLKKDRVFIVTEQKVYVFLFDDFSSNDKVETIKNPKGIIAVSGHPDKTIAVYLGSKKGEVYIKNYTTDSKPILITAHESDIACIGINYDGTLIVTSSDKGTIFRIFHTEDVNGACLQELRRGSDKAEIYSLVFNSDSKFLACSSDRGTIHIFAVNCSSSEDVSEENPKNTTSIWSKILPFKYLSSEWSFAQFRINDLKSICTFCPDNTIIVVSSEGKYYQAKMDTKNGGECSEEKVESLNL